MGSKYCGVCQLCEPPQRFHDLLLYLAIVVFIIYHEAFRDSVNKDDVGLEVKKPSGEKPSGEKPSGETQSGSQTPSVTAPTESAPQGEVLSGQEESAPESGAPQFVAFAQDTANDDTSAGAQTSQAATGRQLASTGYDLPLLVALGSGALAGGLLLRRRIGARAR